jgi:hypothetical protein
MRLRLVLGAGLAVAFANVGGAADERPVGAGTEPLKLDVLVDPTIVVPTRSQDPSPRAPHTTTVRVTLTNVTSKDRHLTFGCPCFLGFEVEAPDGTAAPPEGGGTGCADVLAEVHLPPGGKETKELQWTARSWNGSYAPLAAGTYKVFGTMGNGICGADQKGHSPMRTPPVPVEVRPAAN